MSKYYHLLTIIICYMHWYVVSLLCEIEINSTNQLNYMIMTTFKFIGVKDCGHTCCPHCGAEGRYIYTWSENGNVRSAMAGCYKRLTGMLEKSDEDRYFELLSEKQAKGKELNGWDNKIISLLNAIDCSKITSDWGWLKIRETLSQRKIYLSKKRY